MCRQTDGWYLGKLKQNRYSNHDSLRDIWWVLLDVTIKATKRLLEQWRAEQSNQIKSIKNFNSVCFSSNWEKQRKTKIRSILRILPVNAALTNDASSKYCWYAQVSLLFLFCVLHKPMLYSSIIPLSIVGTKRQAHAGLIIMCWPCTNNNVYVLLYSSVLYSKIVAYCQLN